MIHGAAHSLKNALVFSGNNRVRCGRHHGHNNIRLHLGASRNSDLPCHILGVAGEATPYGSLHHTSYSRERRHVRTDNADDEMSFSPIGFSISRSDAVRFGNTRPRCLLRNRRRAHAASPI